MSEADSEVASSIKFTVSVFSNMTVKKSEIPYRYVMFEEPPPTGKPVELKFELIIISGPLESSQ